MIILFTSRKMPITSSHSNVQTHIWTQCSLMVSPCLSKFFWSKNVQGIQECAAHMYEGRQKINYDLLVLSKVVIWAYDKTKCSYYESKWTWKALSWSAQVGRKMVKFSAGQVQWWYRMDFGLVEVWLCSLPSIFMDAFLVVACVVPIAAWIVACPVEAALQLLPWTVDPFQGLRLFSWSRNS